MNNSNEIQPEGDVFTLSFQCNFLLYYFFMIINWGILYFLYLDTYTYFVLGFLNAALMMVAFHEIIIHNERKQKQRRMAYILTTAVVSGRYPDESSIFEENYSSEESPSIPNNESPKK